MIRIRTYRSSKIKKSQLIITGLAYDNVCNCIDPSLRLLPINSSIQISAITVIKYATVKMSEATKCVNALKTNN